MVKNDEFLDPKRLFQQGFGQNNARDVIKEPKPTTNIL